MLNGRRCRGAGDVAGGDVSPDTVFEYEESDGVVSAMYSGGPVVLGFLVGTRTGLKVSFRYVQLRDDGTTASGRCDSIIENLDDGRLRMHERWAWESQPGSGTSVVEEV